MKNNEEQNNEELSGDFPTMQLGALVGGGVLLLVLVTTALICLRKNKGDMERVTRELSATEMLEPQTARKMKEEFKREDTTDQSL